MSLRTIVPQEDFPFATESPLKDASGYTSELLPTPIFLRVPFVKYPSSKKSASLKGFWLLSEVTPPSEQLLHILPSNGLFTGLSQHFHLLASLPHHTPAFGALLQIDISLNTCPFLIFICFSPRRHSPFKTPSGLFILCVLLLRVLSFTS